VTVLQAPPPPAPPTDSLDALRIRAARDSTDAQLWLLMGRAYLGLGVEAHGATHRSSEDSEWTRAVLDTAEDALVRAAALAGPLGASAVGDSARVLRVGAWAARWWLGWESRGLDAGVETWGPLPGDLRVPPVLDELGENLLRACPAGGVLLTAGDADFYAAWYMRFARGLRPDLLVVPLAAWRSDPVLRARLVADLKLGRRRASGAAGDETWLAELVRRRPVCVSMAFERPPETRPRIRWGVRPLVWVAGPEGRARRSRRAISCSGRCGWRSTLTTPGPNPPSRPTAGRRAPRPRCASQWRRSESPPTCRRVRNNVSYHQASAGRQPG